MSERPCPRRDTTGCVTGELCPHGIGGYHCYTASDMKEAARYTDADYSEMYRGLYPSKAPGHE